VQRLEVVGNIKSFRTKVCGKSEVMVLAYLAFTFDILSNDYF